MVIERSERAPRLRGDVREGQEHRPLVELRMEAPPHDHLRCDTLGARRRDAEQACKLIQRDIFVHFRCRAQVVLAHRALEEREAVAPLAVLPLEGRLERGDVVRHQQLAASDFIQQRKVRVELRDADVVAEREDQPLRDGR